MHFDKYVQQRIFPILNITKWRIQDFPGLGGRGGLRQSPRLGCQPIIWPNFSEKLHKNERNWTQRDVSLAPPLDRPMLPNEF